MVFYTLHNCTRQIHGERLLQSLFFPSTGAKFQLTSSKSEGATDRGLYNQSRRIQK